MLPKESIASIFVKVNLSIRNSQALVTASYNGEIILWRLETGQPYRIFLANNPTFLWY